MKITLHGTRTHDGKTFTFNENALTLLDGRNGVGKSTLLDAIYWCLYGKIRDLYEGSSTVTIEMSAGVITRSTKPNHLVFDTKEKKHLEDEEAQLAIDLLFGNKLIFDTSSYLKQSTSCYLLTAPGDKRMEILNEMTFGETNQTPKKFIDVLEERQKQAKQDLLKAETAYGTLLEIYNEHKFKPTILDVITDSEKTYHENQEKLEEAKKDKIKLSNILTKIKSERERIKRLQDNLTQLNLKLKDLAPGDVEKLELELNELKSKEMKAKTAKTNKLSTVRLIQQTKELIKADQEKIGEYETLASQKFPPEVAMFTGSIESQLLRWKEYKNQEQILKEFPEIQSAASLESTVKSLKEEYTKIIQVEEQMKIYDQFKIIRNKRNAIKVDVIVSSKEIKDLQRILTMMEASRNTHICPNCSVGLRIKENELVLSDTLPVSEQQIKEQSRQILYMEKQKELHSKKRELEKELVEIEGKLPEDIIYDEQIQKKKKLCLTKQAKLERITYLEKPSTPENILHDVGEYRKIQKDLLKINIDDIHERLNTNIESLVTLQENLVKYESEDIIISTKELTKKLQSVREYQRIKQQRDELVVEINDIPIPAEESEILQELERKNEEIRYFKKYIQEYNNYTKQIERDEKLRRSRKNKDNLAIRYEKLLKLKKIVTDLECYLIQTTVDELNELANKILEEIYHGEIQAELALFREVKSKSLLKNEVTLHVIKGDEKRIFKKTSGGEKQIISFVFVITLCLLNPSPILMIDEALSEVDEEYRPICISALRKYARISGKTAIIVNHNDTEGDYDHSKFIT